MKSFEADMLAILPRLKRYARSLSASHADADDLVQDCLEKAFSKRETWRGENLQGWLMTILTNLNRNRLRRAVATPQMVDYDAAGGVEAEHAESDPLARDRITAALERLHPDQRAVLMLVVVEGYAYGEVAAMLEIPPGTVMSRLSRARRTLAAMLECGNIVEFRRNT